MGTVPGCQITSTPSPTGTSATSPSPSASPSRYSKSDGVMVVARERVEDAVLERLAAMDRDSEGEGGTED